MGAETMWVSYGMDRKTTDGRWHIRHPENSPSGRWELYDTKAGTWHGDWRTCKDAKKQAAVICAVERQDAPGDDVGYPVGDA